MTAAARRARRVLVIGWAAVALGQQMAMISLVWVVLDRTGSGALTGLTVLALYGPMVVTAPLVGTLVDRYGLVRVVTTECLVRAALYAALAAMLGTDSWSTPVAFGLMVGIGSSSSGAGIAVRVAMPALSRDEELERSNALLTGGEQLAWLLGPAAAGGVLAAGAGWLTLALYAGVLAAFGLVARTVAPHLTSRPTSPTDEPTTGAMRLLVQDPALRTVLVLTLAFFTAYGPLEPALAVLAKEELHTGAAGFGLLWTSFGVGALAGLVLVRPASRLPAGPFFALAPVVWGVLLLPLALLHELWAAAAVFALAAFLYAPYEPLEATFLQRRVPADRLGAVLGVRRALLSPAAPGGAALGGVLLEVTSAPGVVVVSAGACVVAGLLALRSATLRSLPPVAAQLTS